MILGDSFNSCLVAIVAVDPDVLKDWAASQGIKVIYCFSFRANSHDIFIALIHNLCQLYSSKELFRSRCCYRTGRDSSVFCQEYVAGTAVELI